MYEGGCTYLYDLLSLEEPASTAPYPLVRAAPVEWTREWFHIIIIIIIIITVYIACVVTAGAYLVCHTSTHSHVPQHSARYVFLLQIYGSARHLLLLTLSAQV